MNWTHRDWAAVCVGWLCGLGAYLAIGPKPIYLFLIGFVSAWIGRRLIP